MNGGGEVDLSGRWTGLYTYPFGRPPTPFEAELRESSGCLTGTTTEIGETSGSLGRMLHAVIDGRRDGSSVRFLKMYDGSSHDHDVVHYEGALQPGGDEIDGRWVIPGIWSGTFLMIRASGAEEAAERRVSEEVR